MDVQNPDYVFYEYLRRITKRGGCARTRRQTSPPLHWAPVRCTLVRYIQAARPAPARFTVDIEPESSWAS